MHAAHSRVGPRLEFIGGSGDDDDDDEGGDEGGDGEGGPAVAQTRLSQYP